MPGSAERRPQGNPETGTSSTATNRPNTAILSRLTGPPCGCMFGRDGHEDHCPTRVTSPASLPAARASWLHLRWLGLVDGEGFVEGILRDLGRAS